MVVENLGRRAAGRRTLCQGSKAFCTTILPTAFGYSGHNHIKSYGARSACDRTTFETTSEILVAALTQRPSITLCHAQLVDILAYSAYPWLPICTHIYVGALSMNIDLSIMPKMLRRSQPQDTYMIVGWGVIPYFDRARTSVRKSSISNI